MKYNLELTEQELQSLVGVMDAGVRSLGLKAVKEVSPILEKLEKLEPQGEDDAIR